MELKDIKDGMKVKHPLLGICTIHDRRGDKVSITRHSNGQARTVDETVVRYMTPLDFKDIEQDE